MNGRQLFRECAKLLRILPSSYEKHEENKPVHKSKTLFSSNYQWNNQSMSSVAVAL